MRSRRKGNHLRRQDLLSIGGPVTVDRTNLAILDTSVYFHNLRSGRFKVKGEIL